MGISLAPDIPEHAHFESYGPSFDLGVGEGVRRKDSNTPEYLEGVIESVNRTLQALVL